MIAYNWTVWYKIGIDRLTSSIEKYFDQISEDIAGISHYIRIF